MTVFFSSKNRRADALTLALVTRLMIASMSASFAKERRHHGNVSSARLLQGQVARAVEALIHAARQGATRDGECLGARGSAVCPWVLLPATEVLLVEPVETPRTPVARWGEVGAALGSLEEWRPPSSQAILCLHASAPTKEDANGQI
jgi:hypothetical protein